ncbi:PTS sugar transporter subunit IIA [Haloferacaceae archaeon DSL9]
MSSSLDADFDALLPPELVTLEEPPADKRACIEFLLDRAVAADRVADRDAALDDLYEREAEATTGVGMGIGIPHAKTAAVVEPTIVFGRSETGVDFDAMDDEDATLLFLLLVPEDGAETHLEILSSISRALVHEEVRARLHEAETTERVRSVLREAIA